MANYKLWLKSIFIFSLALLPLQSIMAVDLKVTVTGLPHCNDGIDNDNDSFIDYPNDPGCESVSDENEIDPPPPPVTGGSSGSSSGGGGGARLPIQPIVNDNSAIFSGFAYPGSLVSIIQNGKIVANIQAGPDAKFEVRIHNLVSGDYVFGIRAQDKNNNVSIIQSFSITVSSGITTIVSGIFIPPTIFADKQEVRRGDNITFFGQAPPQATVSVIINSDHEIIRSVLADNQSGAWLLHLNTSPLKYGTHFARAKALTITDTSELSKNFSFKISDRNIAAVLGNNPELISDFNNDGRINLLDFSIAAYWYGRDHPEAGDLNGDGLVNLVDMSILAFYWTG